MKLWCAEDVDVFRSMQAVHFFQLPNSSQYEKHHQPVPSAEHTRNLQQTCCLWQIRTARRIGHQRLYYICKHAISDVHALQDIAESITCYRGTTRVLRNYDHGLFRSYLPAYIAAGLPKHMSRQPNKSRFLCSQSDDRNHWCVTVTSHRIRTSEMSSARFRKNRQIIQFVVTSSVRNRVR